ncbi:MAG: MBL fold metallo-hydrolase [Clostridia bacterium]|nr:MBL fold metallo-hydrolase [Clostridia bacterium]
MRFCPLYSGSSGNVSVVWRRNEIILVDAGVSARRIVCALKALDIDVSEVDGVLITHEHIDHIRGIGVLARRYRLPVYANEATWNAMPASLGDIPGECVRIIESDAEFYIKDMRIRAFRTSHDAAEPVGYSFCAGERRMSVVTDIGCMDARVINELCGSSLVLIESNHDVEMLRAGSYPYPLKRRILGEFGHLSNDDCAQALLKLYHTGLKTAVLGHLSQENNMEPLAYETVRAALNSDGIFEDMLAVSLAHRDRMGGVYDVY